MIRKIFVGLDKAVDFDEITVWVNTGDFIISIIDGNVVLNCVLGEMPIIDLSNTKVFKSTERGCAKIRGQVDSGELYTRIRGVNVDPVYDYCRADKE